jgi:hypothetical protein
MRLHVVEALALFAAGVLGGIEWLRDWWRSRTDAAIDRHPQALALRALEDVWWGYDAAGRPLSTMESTCERG